MSSATSQINWEQEYQVSVTDPEKTGLRLYHVHRPDTGTVMSFAEFNNQFDVHSGVAWAGARTSRSADPYEQIFTEIKQAADEGKSVAGQKLEKVFVNYGHASVAGMAPVFLYLHSIPGLLPFWIFNHISVGDGQELSTRYVNFQDLSITPLADLVDMTKLKGEQQQELTAEWQHLQKVLVEGYNKWYDLIWERLEKQFSTEEDPVSRSTLRARTLDIVRMWVPLGAKTSMALLNSVRMWVDIVSQLRDKHDPELLRLAEQINATLNLSDHPQHGEGIKADLSGLTKYAYPRETLERNLKDLQEFLVTETDFADFLSEQRKDSQKVQAHVSAVDLLEGYEESEILLAQYILTLYPDVNEQDLLNWITQLTPEQKRQVSYLLFRDHNHHNLMRNMGDIRGQGLFVINTSLAYIRDLNRHRAWGRFISMLEAEDFGAILGKGFNDNFQLRETEGLQDLHEEFNADMEAYYERLHAFYERLQELLPGFPEEVLLRLIPFGHQVTMHMSAPLTQQSYMISQRISGGGDMGYRHVVYLMLNKLRDKHPLLESFLSQITTDVDPNSEEQFKSRK